MDRILRWLRGALGLSVLLGAGAAAFTLFVTAVIAVGVWDAPSLSDWWKLTWAPAAIGGMAGLLYSVVITITGGAESKRLGSTWSIMGGFLAGMLAPVLVLALAAPTAPPGVPTWLGSFFELLPGLLPFGLGGTVVGVGLAMVMRRDSAALGSGQAVGLEAGRSGVQEALVAGKADEPRTVSGDSKHSVNEPDRR